MQAEAVRFLTAVLPELGAKYPRLIFGVQTVPPPRSRTVCRCRQSLPLRSRSLLEKKRLIYHFLMQEEQRIGRRVQVTGQAYQMLMQYPYERNVGQLEQVIRTSCTNAYPAAGTAASASVCRCCRMPCLRAACCCRRPVRRTVR